MKKQSRYHIVARLTVAFTISLLVMYSCKDDLERASASHNMTLTFTRAGETPLEQIPTMRLFTFRNNNTLPTDKMFYQELYEVTRDASGGKVTAKIETGSWNMALLSTPNGGNIIPPVAGTVMSLLPMYTYQPTINAGKSSDAHEIYLDNKVTPTITSGGNHTMAAQLNRTVAKVELIIEKATPNFNLSGTHWIQLHNIPSTISYTGALLPNQTFPDTLASSLRAPITLQNDGTGWYKGRDVISFIIPAHRGTDYTNAAPADTTTLKMNVTVNLERSSGTLFSEQFEIPYVAKQNKTLRVHITVDDGVMFVANVLDWEGVPLDATVGAAYKNWLYVKKDATGAGTSWRDPIGNISSAVAKATTLLAAGKTVNGILVAGGSSSAMLYNEGFSVPANVKIYGGWEGVAGTELAASATATDVYASTARNLKDYKAVVNVGTNTIGVNTSGAVLDGFVFQNAGASNTSIVSVSNGGWVNAIEIKNNTIAASGNVLSLSNGTASNVLVSGNNRSVSVSGNGKLINATVVNNTVGATISGGTILNTIFWPEIVTLSGTNAIQYSGFIGEVATIPSGTGNIHLNTTNEAWFSSGITAPGPHFKLTTTADRYMAKSNRAPMLGRGDEALYTTHLGQLASQDINGSVRTQIDPQDVTKRRIDIGCYEESGYEGFRLTWASDRLYISAKGGYYSNVPLMLPGNADPETQIDVTSTVAVLSSSTWSAYEGFTPSVSDHVVIGTVRFKNPGSTPANDYTATVERQWGTIKVSTNLGGYLPDTQIDVYQVPGANQAWETGYVGSFHKNNQVGARYISGYNTGNWEARIISGLEWIKIDQLGINDGTNITDADEGTTPGGGYYKEVQEVWGGVVKGSGNIKFRVGIKSKNPNTEPRYGLIVISRSGGSALFFVRQGEEPDYLYRSGDPRIVSGSTNLGRTHLAKFTVYNLTDPQGRSSADLSRTTSGFTQYPTQVGYYFKWNQLTSFIYNYGSSLGTASTSTWITSTEVCPTGYRHPYQYQYIHTIYDKAADTTGSVSPSDDASKNNFQWGAYADGYYDQLTIDALTVTPSSTHAGKYNVFVGSGANIAAKGILMVSHYDYSSLFFPAGGVMSTGGSTAEQTVYKNVEYVMIWTGGSTGYGTGTNPRRNTHWSWRDGSSLTSAHIGMNCTTIAAGEAGNIRCVKE